MNRRTFLTGNALLLGGASAGIAWTRYTAPQPDLPALITELNALSPLAMRSTGTWSPFQIFSHLAQSIEYSMTGYPKMKSPLFRHTAGSLAFFAFGTAGTMQHPLAEPIPGAPALPDTGDTTQAHARLIKALTDFTHWTNPLYPHFAYGTLSKEEYAQAHLMHIRNHLQETHTSV